MSRSGYYDDLDNWSLIKYRGQVASAIRGKRGQALLKELLQALDEMPSKRLITQDGSVCALGALGVKRGIELDILDTEDPEAIAAAFGVSHQLIREVEYENDESFETPEERWKRMRAWVQSKLEIK